MCDEKFLRESVKSGVLQFQDCAPVLFSSTIRVHLSLSLFSVFLFFSHLAHIVATWRIDEIYILVYFESRSKTKSKNSQRGKSTWFFVGREGYVPSVDHLELITPMIRAIGGVRARARALEESRDFRGQVNGDIIIATGRYSL